MQFKRQNSVTVACIVVLLIGLLLPVFIPEAYEALSLLLVSILSSLVALVIVIQAIWRMSRGSK